MTSLARELFIPFKRRSFSFRMSLRGGLHLVPRFIFIMGLVSIFFLSVRLGALNFKISESVHITASNERLSLLRVQASELESRYLLLLSDNLEEVRVDGTYVIADEPRFINRKQSQRYSFGDISSVP